MPCCGVRARPPPKAVEPRLTGDDLGGSNVQPTPTSGRDMIPDVIGPYVIFDKSAIQMLTANEIEELTHHFNFICVPTLMREIIADLHKRPDRSSRIPEAVVRALAGRIGRMHPMTPPSFRRMAISNLFGSPVPVDGRIPIDTTGPQVAATDRVVSYDVTLEQRIWQRWAGGNFSKEDIEVGQAWRSGLEIVNLKALGKNWQGFLDSRIGRPENVQDAVGRVDRLMRQPLVEIQSDLLAALIVFLRAPADAGGRFALRYGLGGPATIADVAPYASAVLRLYVVFLAAVRYEFVRLRASNYVDLQYLFYQPFCMGFASNDALHCQLWGATSGPGLFIDGARLKEDLAKRAAWRASLTEEERREHFETHSFYPVEMPGSIINEVWSRWVKPRAEYMPEFRRRTPIDEIPASVLEQVRRDIDGVKAAQKAKPRGLAEWPFGSSTAEESPLP